ncbi:D-hexose-6-phosphate mutarotase [Lysobacter sp. LF1]|uniref:Putative glucose-6-phosphate 1-epimerase n=1 Tax=Lysobacter stagni TaxID=3045172 RepID=A0ABT6XH64_9GAMM|nr:D-hexose-6-phosphate mutarotase [Lysobacter sp. LF1]MDI9239492.1 D-hexose-6-phosphate mutarotase [Lysobacter sp. LF1]
MTHSIEPFTRDDRPCLRLVRSDGASAEVSLHGAQVLSWKTSPDRERLYLSPNASRSAGGAIRGGIPVVFPQFAGRGPMIKHGFARLLEWQPGEMNVEEAPTAILELVDGEQTWPLWPHRFRARLQVSLTPSSLTVQLEILNRGEEAFEFTTALHTYLRVRRLPGVSLTGLESHAFEDSARGAVTTAATHVPVRFEGEVDRVYPDAPHALTLHDDERVLGIEAEGFRDTIVWNPGATLAASIGDLGAGEHLRFVCVESGTVVAPVRLAPGERWRGVQRLSERTGA